MKYKDGLYIYFSNNMGEYSQPKYLNSEDDIEPQIEKHKNYYDRYIVIKRDSINGDSTFTRGEIERPYTRKRVKR